MSQGAPTATQRERWTILVVDDDVVDRMAVKRALLGSGSPVELVEATDVETALELAYAHDFHCALVDFRLPDGTALDFVDRLAVDRRRELPIIVLTGLQDEETALRALEHGVQDYLVKGELGGLQLWRSIRYAVERKKLVKMQQRLMHADRLASIGQLAAGIAHEINNPAAYVQGNLEVMEEDVGALQAAFTAIRDLIASCQDPGLRQAVDAVISRHDVFGHLDECREVIAANLFGMERITSITGDLRRFSRMDEDSEIDLIQLNDAIESACNIVSSKIRQHATLTKELGPLPPIVGDRGRLTQLFTNLLINAVQSLDDSAAHKNEIRLTSGERRDAITVVVEDTGQGIPADRLQRIFEPFYTTKSQRRGTGLGLSLCLDIVRKHGGDIRVTSEVGCGARFEVVIPKDTGLAVTRARREICPPAPPSRRARVLVIDDEREILAAYRRILQPDHDVVDAPNGRAALDLLDSDRRFDAIFCDLVMPELDGVALYHTLREKWPSLTPRVVLCTAGVTTERIREFLTTVDNPCMHKPISRSALLRAVARCVDPS